MATFDQLSAEQRAIVELVLQQGKTYDELADMLGMPEPRVRELARDALVDLAPVSGRGVEEDWRGQLADYVLGQQSGPEATATRGHLRRSEAARTWARSLLDSLDQLYANGSMPAIPEGERGRRASAAPPQPPRGSAERARRRRPRTLDRRPVMRRRLLAGAARRRSSLLLAVLVWPIGVLTGDDDDSSGDSASSQRRGRRADYDGQASRPQRTGRHRVVVDRRASSELLVQAARLAPSGQNEAYEVWLYNSQSNARRSARQVTDKQGTFQGSARCPRLREVPLHRRVARADRQQHERQALGRVGAARPDAEAPGDGQQGTTQRSPQRLGQTVAPARPRR